MTTMVCCDTMTVPFLSVAVIGTCRGVDTGPLSSTEKTFDVAPAARLEDVACTSARDVSALASDRFMPTSGVGATRTVVDNVLPAVPAAGVAVTLEMAMCVIEKVAVNSVPDADTTTGAFLAWARPGVTSKNRVNCRPSALKPAVLPCGGEMGRSAVSLDWMFAPADGARLPLNVATARTRAVGSPVVSWSLNRSR